MTGAAVVKAARNLREKILDAAAAALGVAASGLELDGGIAKQQSGGGQLALETLGPLEGVGVVRIYQEDPADNTDDFTSSVFTYAAQAILVEVDTLTGKVSVLKVHSAVDAGRVINRQGFEGQSEGGIAQSIGYTLMEDTVMEAGQVRNAALSTYVVPYISDIPDDILTSAVENADPQTPIGAKAIAEIVMLPTPSAILNAVYDALGVRYTQIPLTPERVLAELPDAAGI